MQGHTQTCEMALIQSILRHKPALFGGLISENVYSQILRRPLRDTEEAVVRPYWLVDDIDAAFDAATTQGAFVAHSPLEIPGKGPLAIYV